jgi:hypothetical protein
MSGTNTLAYWESEVLWILSLDFKCVIMSFLLSNFHKWWPCSYYFNYNNNAAYEILNVYLCCKPLTIIIWGRRAVLRNGCHDTQLIDIQHNDTQHKVLISVIQHNDTQHYDNAIMLNVIVLSVAIYLLLCWVSLRWMSLCWVSWPPRNDHGILSFPLQLRRHRLQIDVKITTEVFEFDLFTI